MRNFTRSLVTPALALAAVAAVALPARAAALDPTRVPADAKWVVHLDLDAIRDGKTLDVVRSTMTAHELERIRFGMTMLQQYVGLSVERDLHDVTLFASDFTPTSAVVVANAKLPQQRLVGFLSRRPEFKQESVDGREIMSWSDDRSGRTNFGVFYDENTTLVSGSKEALQSAMKMLGGDGGKSISADGVLAKAAEKGTIMFVWGEKLSELAKLDRTQSPLVEKMQSGWMMIKQGEAGGLNMQTQVTAVDEESAKEMKKVIDGIQAFVHLNASKDDRAKAADIAMGKMETTVEEDKVKLDMTLAPDTIREMINLTKPESENRL